MTRFIIRLVINGVAIWVASEIIDGVTLYTEDILGVIIVALVFGLVNAIIKPLVKLVAFPLMIITLGMITLVINAFLLWFVAALAPALDVVLFMPAFWGALIVSLVSWALSLFLDDDK